MVILNTSAARSTPRRVNGTYSPPTPLEDLHILDHLELAGSQYRAAAALSMHQSTVCRSVQLMKRQFHLVPQQHAATCRYGPNSSLQYLRLAYREHRLMKGLLRIGSDVLHQSLLVGMGNVQQVPARFRHGDHWAELVCHGLLDGAIVSSFSLSRVLPVDQTPQWEGLAVVPLGQLRLQLVTNTPGTRRVLLPRKGVMPLLRETLEWHGFAVEQQPMACQEPAAWVKRARDRKLALPICPGLLDHGWLEGQGLAALAEQPVLSERLWLLMPKGIKAGQTARRCVRLLRAQIKRGENNAVNA